MLIPFLVLLYLLIVYVLLMVVEKRKKIPRNSAENIK